MYLLWAKWEIFISRFQCTISNNEYKSSNLKRVLYALAGLEDKNDLSKDFYVIKKQWKKIQQKIKFT